MGHAAPEDWQRLASYVISARTSAGFTTRQDFETATGVTARTLGKLENGHRVSAETLAAVAKTLGWTPDSPQRVMAGLEPLPVGRPGAGNGAVPVPPPPAVAFEGDGPEAEFIAGFIAKILRRLSAEDQAVIGYITRMTDGEGRPWSLERKLLEIEKYVDAAEGSERSRPAAGLGFLVHARANARPDRISVRS